jgi:hypothetical protein
MVKKKIYDRSIARQRHGKQALSAIRAVISVDPCKVCIRESSSKVVEREREWGESSAVKEDGFG